MIFEKICAAAGLFFSSLLAEIAWHDTRNRKVSYLIRTYCSTVTKTGAKTLSCPPNSQHVGINTWLLLYRVIVPNGWTHVILPYQRYQNQNRSIGPSY